MKQQWSSGDTDCSSRGCPHADRFWTSYPESHNRIAQTAIVAERRAAEAIPALCLAGMIHALNAAKPRMPRFGTEQMKYMRSRPWRSRGPWFDNRAGPRRRGRRADELVAAVSDELQESVLPVGVEDVEAEDVLVTSASAWPVPERMPAVWVAHDRARQPIDQLAEAIITAHMLSSLNDDSATSSSSSRQSA